MARHDIWARIEAARDRLQAAGPDDPIMADFRAAWAQLPERDRKMAETLFRPARKRTDATAPLNLLFHCIDVGLYPPPEVLLALHQCWRDYLDGAGKVTLETAFIGRPRQRVGSFAARSARSSALYKVKREFALLLGAGLSRAKAAEHLHRSGATKVEPETLLRSLRGYPAKGDTIAQLYLKQGAERPPQDQGLTGVRRTMPKGKKKAR